MTARPPAATASEIYPARYFSASPTYNSWVRLTCAGFHALRREPGFEGQSTFFHINHPIRYVRLTGPITSIVDDIHPSFIILTLDDSSGRTAEIKLTRLKPELVTPECPSNTAVDNVNVHFSFGAGFQMFVDSERVDVGTVLSVKGTLNIWRGALQMEMKRVRVLQTTGEELEAWVAASNFRAEVLNCPWVLASEQRRALDAKAREEAERDRRRARAKVEFYRKRNERTKGQREKAERRAEREERIRVREEKKMNKDALI